MTPSFTPPPSPLLQPLPHTSPTAVWQQFTCSFPKLNTNKTETIFFFWFGDLRRRSDSLQDCIHEMTEKAAGAQSNVYGTFTVN